MIIYKGWITDCNGLTRHFFSIFVYDTLRCTLRKLTYDTNWLFVVAALVICCCRTPNFKEDKSDFICLFISINACAIVTNGCIGYKNRGGKIDKKERNLKSLLKKIVINAAWLLRVISTPLYSLKPLLLINISSKMQLANEMKAIC